MARHAKFYELSRTSIGSIDTNNLMRGEPGRRRIGASADVDSRPDPRSEFTRQMEAMGDNADWVRSMRFDEERGWLEVWEPKLDVTPEESAAARAALIAQAQAEERRDKLDYARPGYADLAYSIALSGAGDAPVLDEDMYKNAVANTETLPKTMESERLRAKMAGATGRTALLSSSGRPVHDRR